MNSSIAELATRALRAAGPDIKLAAIDILSAALAVSPTPTFTTATVVERGLPDRPVRVAPKDVLHRKLTTPEGRAILIHAIAHIEYSAIDLALDHALRFPGFPSEYYSDWLGVAIEEGYHFRLLRGHLQALGHDYGDFPVHDSLWQMALKTKDDALDRMALVPRLLEARGLDATPPLQKRLTAAGDHAAASLLDVILHDEEGHVGIGDKWFRHICEQRKLEPEVTFRQLITRHKGPWPQTPMNYVSRLKAGFSQTELDNLTALAPHR